MITRAIDAFYYRFTRINLFKLITYIFITSFVLSACIFSLKYTKSFNIKDYHISKEISDKYNRLKQNLEFAKQRIPEDKIKFMKAADELEHLKAKESKEFRKRVLDFSKKINQQFEYLKISYIKSVYGENKIEVKFEIDSNNRKKEALILYLVSNNFNLESYENKIGVIKQIIEIGDQ